MTDPDPKKRDRIIAHLRKRLAYFRSVPPHRREAEIADAGVDKCLALLRDLGVDESGNDKT